MNDFVRAGGGAVTITADQIKGARKLLGWSAATLAIKSRRKLLGVVRAESSTLPPQQAENSLRRIREALEAAGVEFTNGDQPGVRMRKTEAP